MAGTGMGRLLVASRNQRSWCPAGVSGMDVDAGSAIGGGPDRASVVPAAIRVRAKPIASSVLARARRCVVVLLGSRRAGSLGMWTIIVFSFR
jgi:hypothetical protein